MGSDGRLLPTFFDTLCRDAYEIRVICEIRGCFLEKLYLCHLIPKTTKIMKRIILLIFLLFAMSVQAQPRAKHVVLIGLDGWAAHDLDKAHDIPNIRMLMQGGSVTLHKRSVLPSSSGVNWASMFMGVGPEGTGYTQWDSKFSVFTPSDKGPGGMFPTVFTQLHIANPDAESFCACQWDGIKYVVDTSVISHVVLFPDSPEGTEDMANYAASHIAEKQPALSVLAWDYPDYTGHTCGWYSKEYYEMLPQLDRYLQTVVEAIEASPMASSTLIIVTSDHGGHDMGHGMELDTDLFCPLVLYGPGVQAKEMKGAIYQYDIAATIASVLRLPVPDSWRGKPITEAFK